MGKFRWRSSPCEPRFGAIHRPKAGSHIHLDRATTDLSQFRASTPCKPRCGYVSRGFPESHIEIPRRPVFLSSQIATGVTCSAPVASGLR